MRSILDDEGVAEGRSLFAPDPSGARRIACVRRVVFPKKFWQRAMPTICWLLFHETLMVGYLKSVLSWAVIE
ncbi:hypothetical protein JM49_22950 [Pseudomonas chlororaphis subsp. aurantiaca]|jgi:hypothetical protein|nr:hypothetical protein JM49_22950 [Pseudomonas chlororaphis subsp. aurantiaca]